MGDDAPQEPVERLLAALRVQAARHAANGHYHAAGVLKMIEQRALELSAVLPHAGQAATGDLPALIARISALL